MAKKMFKGKAIYNPSGKASEYSEWACNFYVGCSNECAYCYLKKGRGAKILGGNKPTLKKCFKNKEHAKKVFEKEAKQNVEELRKYGLFFSFSTDPMLPETIDLTFYAATVCKMLKIPVKILTKRTDWIKDIGSEVTSETSNKFIAFGFSITGKDGLEINASSNLERIKALKTCKDLGFKTFVSFEPMFSDWYVIDILRKHHKYIDLAKIGLGSGAGKIKYLYEFIEDVLDVEGMRTKIYFKDGLIKQANVNRADLWGNAVERDYDIFT